MIEVPEREEKRQPQASDYPITIRVEIAHEDNQVYQLDPNVSLGLIQRGLANFMSGGGKPREENPEARALHAAMKAAVKGVLLMFGSKVLDFYLGKDHEKPGKGDDLVEWYSGQFAKIGIAMAMKNTTIATGARDGSIIRLFEIRTESNTIDLEPAASAEK